VPGDGTSSNWLNAELTHCQENAVAAVTLRTSHHNVKYNKNGHVYALAKPKAGGDQRDFEFANYPAFLIVARD
jgi:hypothetical protein